MSNNKILLDGCLKNFRIENELSTNESETFELFSLTQITKSEDLPFEVIQNSIVDGGNDGGIDSVIIIVDDLIPESIDDLDEIKISKKSEVIIIISQCKKESSFKELSLDKLITTLPELFDLSKSESDLLVRFNSSLVQKALIAKEAWKRSSISGGRLEIIFNYCAYAEEIEVNGAFDAKTKQLETLTNKIFIGASVKYRNYSSAELLKLFQSQKNDRLQLTYKENPLSTQYSSYGIGYVGTVKLADYQKFLRDDDGSIREDLFESNIRHFQGQVDVNKKIKESIEEINNEDFWWLNNGITIIASGPSLVGTTLSIENVQVVNGLQTSYSIFLNHNGDESDSRSVLVKVIITEDKTVIDHIIASTNSQNPVSASLLRATDDVQRELEMYFLNSGYYYDRRKNYYKNLSKPANRIYSIQTTAQAVESIIFGNPHSARSKPTSLIKDDVTYHRIFNQNVNYRVYLNSSLLSKKTIDLWSEIADREVKDKLSNFKLHLARIAASFVLEKAQVTAIDIANINLENLSQEKFNECYTFLTNEINTYLSSNPSSNLINIAKAKGLTDSLLAGLVVKFAQS